MATTTGNTRVVDDASPQLGGNLNLAGYWLTDGVSQNILIDPARHVQLEGNIQIKKWNSTPVPAVQNNYNIIVASNVGTGGSGLYVTNDEGISNQELITKAKAVVYSIIF